MSMRTRETVHPELAAMQLPLAEKEHQAYRARHVMAIARIGLGWTFLWAFFDKTFGLGFATASENAWVNGGSPTFGFLNFGTEGKTFHDFFAGLSGPVADWTFMIGLLGIGVALTLGIGMRIAAVAGGLLMLSMWVAQWPLENNPIFDDHVAYTIVLAALALYGAGRTWGLGDRWERSQLVRRMPFLT